jgi:hypothetical protein
MAILSDKNYLISVQTLLSSPIDYLRQVFHNEQQLVGVARACLEREVLIEGPGLIVLGVHEQSPGAYGIGCM